MHKKPVFLLVLAVVAIFGLYQLKYYLGYASDLRSRPWAYSLEPGAKLLVGRWQGSFTDPAGIAKTLSLEIDLPVTEEERQKRATRRARRRVRAADKQAFDGTAVVVSRLGEERYTLYGSVDEADMHLVKMHFGAEDEAKRILPNEALFEALFEAPSGRWEGDRLEIALAFTRLDEQGFSQSESEGVVIDGKLVWQDSPADRRIPVVLSRSSR